MATLDFRKAKSDFLKYSLEGIPWDRALEGKRAQESDIKASLLPSTGLVHPKK